MLELEKEYYWNIVEFDVFKSFKEEDNGYIFNVHFLSEEKLHGNNFKSIIQGLEEYKLNIPIVSKFLSSEKNKINKKIEYVSGENICYPFQSWITTTLVGKVSYSLKDLELLEDSSVFNFLKITRKGKKKIISL